MYISINGRYQIKFTTFATHLFHFSIIGIKYIQRKKLFDFILIVRIHKIRCYFSYDKTFKCYRKMILMLYLCDFLIENSNVSFESYEFNACLS